jgi:D-3-phosphoglycerate dehydrogenase / 2-oxoglutarate reductase
VSGPGRVFVDSPPFPLELVRELLGGTGVAVEAPARPWAGRDVVGALIDGGLRAEDFARLPALKVVACDSIGFDQIDLAAARSRRVWVCNVPDYCVDEMADSTMALLLALLRGVVALDRSVREGAWNDHAAGPLRRVAGTRLGIVGFGRTGRAVARRALTLGFEVWATDPLVDVGRMVAAGVRAAPFDVLLKGCTAITLHLPLTPETEGLIGERELALMPEGSYLVNTARGGLVDTGPLLAALDLGHLAGAALDVLPIEPASALNPAPQHPRLIVTPHAAWYSSDSEREVYRRATLSVRAVLEGRAPEGVVVQGDPHG